MTGQAPFTLRGRNPEVLSCIANLSNDEVFTPPEFANQMLVEGLKEQMPDLQARVDHILTKQVFGIGITRLTAMMARRSVYCSKHARGPHSICKKFPTDDGNM